MPCSRQWQKGTPGQDTDTERAAVSRAVPAAAKSRITPKLIMTWQYSRAPEEHRYRTL